MAQVIGGNRIRLDNGQVVNAQTGGWYDGRQFWNGTLSDPGVINNQSNQQGAGQAVSAEVNAQSAKAQGVSAPAFENYLATQRAKTTGTPGAQAPVPAGSSPGMLTGAGTPSAGSQGMGFDTPQANVPDLQGIYKSLNDNSGVEDLQKKLLEQEKAYIDAVGQIDDNPFLSEATRVGRVAKLDDLFQKRTANLRGEIATKKADVETQLQLQLKQFDINSQSAQQSLQQFQTLLQSGALDNISGEDIANLTRSTGISSNMINSAIQSSKNAKKEKPTMVSFDDGTNQGFVLVDPDSGQILNKQVLGSSKSSGGGSKEPKIGSGEYGASAQSSLNQFVSMKTNSYGHISPTDWTQALQAFLADALGTREDFIKAYARYTDPNRGDFSKAYGFSPDLRAELTGDY